MKDKDKEIALKLLNKIIEDMPNHNQSTLNNALRAIINKTDHRPDEDKTDYGFLRK